MIRQVSLSCIPCLEGKQSRKSFKPSESATTDVLQLVHADVCGPMEMLSLGGAKYFVCFEDDFSKKIFVYPIKTKSEVTRKTIAFG